jgi:hypothetical protein
VVGDFISPSACGHDAAAGIFFVPFLGHGAMGPLPEECFVKHPVPKSRRGRGKLLPGLEEILRLVVVLHLLVRHGDGGWWWRNGGWDGGGADGAIFARAVSAIFSILVDFRSILGTIDFSGSEPHA